MSASFETLDYSGPVFGVRQWCRSAIAALAWVLAYPSTVAAPLLYAAHTNWLPQHFLCCKHPEVALLAFVAAPLGGAVIGLTSIAQMWRYVGRPRPRGMAIACIAVLLSGLLAALGVGLIFGLKA